MPSSSSVQRLRASVLRVLAPASVRPAAAPASVRPAASRALILFVAAAGLARASDRLAETHDSTFWHPPLAEPLLVTGTFGEPRSAHLHSGLDLSTGREIGRPVLAVAPGSVVRLRARAGGYGRAVYLQTDRGPLAVYAHLERFAAPLEAFLRERQQAQGEYEIDLFPTAGRFRFAAGDTLAFSGATGSGPPHLHFELRHGDQPVNPLTVGIRAPDQVAPSIGPLRLRALGPDGWVEEGGDAEVNPLRARVIRVWGPIGIEAAVLDRTGHNGSRLSPLDVTVSVDGEPLFERAFRSLDFSRGVDLKRVYGRACQGSRRWVLRMYRWPLGTDADVAQARPEQTGILDASLLGPGTHQVCVEASDAAGRRDRACVEIDVRQPVVATDWRCARGADGGWLIGVRLAEPADPDRLPLRLRGRVASEGGGLEPEAPWGSPVEMVPLDQGWHVAHVRGDRLGEVQVLTTEGRPVTPALFPTGGRDGDSGHPRVRPQIAGDARSIHVGAACPDEHDDRRATVQMRVDEGGATLFLRVRDPLPGIPIAQVVWDDSSRTQMMHRGFRGDGIWEYGLAPIPSAVPRQSRRVDLTFATPDGLVKSTLPCEGLLLLPDAPGQRAWIAPGVSLMTGEGSFGGPLLLTYEPPRATESPGQAVSGAGTGAGAGSGPPGAGGGAPAGAGLHGTGAGDGTPAGTAAPGVQGQGGLQPVSSVARVHPEWWPLGRTIEVSFGPPAWLDPGATMSPRWGIYRLSEAGDWLYEGGEATNDGIAARVAAVGCWAVLEDRAAPRVVWTEPAEDVEIRRPPIRLTAAVEEEGSGFDPRDADLFLDGRMLIARWEIDEELLVGELEGPLAPGEHRWEVRVVDRAGNVCREEFMFRIGDGDEE